MSSPLPGTSSVVRLSVDCMGGDRGPAATLPACRAFLDSHPLAELVLVGRPEDLAIASAWARCTVVAASEVVQMNDPVEVALRRKKNSSMRLAISQLLADVSGRPVASACVSAGNTGALMALGRNLLRTITGIDRPAIASVMPNRQGRFTTVLDLGANVDCTAENLLQFALMGSALVTAVQGKDNPTVGLLNIGEETIKGSEIIKQAGDLLRAAANHGLLSFHGNVEGDDIFKGSTDVVVCDGFVGNAALKASEGLASMLSDFLRQEFTRNVFTRLAGVIALPVLNRFKSRVDPRRYNGAALLGLRGLVFKSHGSADAFAFENALNRAHDAARNGLLERVQGRIHDTLPALPAAGPDMALNA